MNNIAALTRAAEAHARGDLKTAQDAAAAAVAQAPRDLTTLRFAGALFCQAGDPGRGAPLLKRALEQQPSDVQTRVNLIQALTETGDLGAAERIGAEATGDSTPNLLRARAGVARLLGKLDEAAGLLKQAASQSPNDWAIWNNLGNALNDLQRSEEALEALFRARQLNPRSAIVHLNIGRALVATGKHEESSAEFERAVALDPTDGTAMFELGQSLLQRGLAEEALPRLSEAARLLRTDPDVYVKLGLTYARLDQLPQAEQAYRVAIHVAPAYGAAYLNLCILLERKNRIDEVRQLLEDARANGVEDQEMAYVQALLKRREGKLAEAIDLARQSDAPSVDASWKAQFIGEVADKMGDVDTAFEAFSEMNRIASELPDAAGLDRSSYRKMLDQFRLALTPDWYSTWRKAEISDELPTPAFLVGFFRSGTTLLDTVLMGHPATQVAEEEPMLSEVEGAIGHRMRVRQVEQPELTRLRKLFFDSLKQPLEPGKLLIDKNPLATQRAPIIHRLFPGAPIIFTLRHPCDVVLSCFMQNFQASESMVAFHDLENGARLYDSAMAFWKKARDVMPLNVHEVRYEDMVEDLEGEIRPLLDFLGLPWDDRVLDHQTTARERGYIRTPSYAQVTEKIYRRASGRWTRYRKQMEPALPILEPWVKEFGYSLD